ncbi:hypothetical protein B0H11DRAFT_1951196 [Mycena galericulata]|nr:hypothetical protein B0H11DRAFT_1951196 [Mycena galericulata]
MRSQQALKYASILFFEATQTQLTTFMCRTVYAPQIDLARYPAFVALKSTNNTPIESLWHWFQDQCGKNLLVHITKGRDEGIFFL